MIDITDSQFAAEVLESPIPVVVDFWAPWCGPCKMIAPLLEQIQAEYDGRIKIVKLNVDENHEIGMKFGVRGIPTLMTFSGGQVKKSHVGAAPKQKLTELVEDLFSE